MGLVGLLFFLNSPLGIIYASPTTLEFSCIDLLGAAKEPQASKQIPDSLAVSLPGHTVWELPAHPSTPKIRPGWAGLADAINAPTYAYNERPVIEELRALVGHSVLRSKILFSSIWRFSTPENNLQLALKVADRRVRQLLNLKYNRGLDENHPPRVGFTQPRFLTDEQLYAMQAMDKQMKDHRVGINSQWGPRKENYNRYGGWVRYLVDSLHRPARSVFLDLGAVEANEYLLLGKIVAVINVIADGDGNYRVEQITGSVEELATQNGQVRMRLATELTPGFIDYPTKSLGEKHHPVRPLGKYPILETSRTRWIWLLKKSTTNSEAPHTIVAQQILPARASWYQPIFQDNTLISAVSKIDLKNRTGSWRDRLRDPLTRSQEFNPNTRQWVQTPKEHYIRHPDQISDMAGNWVHGIVVYDDKFQFVKIDGYVVQVLPNKDFPNTWDLIVSDGEKLIKIPRVPNIPSEFYLEKAPLPR